MEEKNVSRSRRRPRKKRSAWLGLTAGILCVAAVFTLLWGMLPHTNHTDIQIPSAETKSGEASESKVQYPQVSNTQNPAESDGWYLTLVNQWNPIPEDWEAELTEVEGGQQVDKRIYEPLMEMLEAAREDNWDQLPLVVSGYRTEKKQQELYDDKVKEYCKQGHSKDEAKALAEQWVAIPGTSEHQLGLAVDINGATYDVYLWLQANSYKYGFIFRYPGNKTDMTGVAEEVWHYRYVGKEAAAEIYEQGLCLEEYLETWAE